MATPTFVFLDTNILFRVITQGQEGCELEHLQELSRYVEDSTISHLVPEVVVLELDKQYSRFENAVSVELAKVEKHLSDMPEKKKVWNELGDIPAYLKEKLNDRKRETIRDAKVRHDEIQKLITSERAIRLVFDSDIWLRAKRRTLAGRVANTEGNAETDCCILESLLKYFEEHGLCKQLLFCTENLQDFCLQLNDKKLAIHPSMRGGLPPTEVFKNLASLVSFARDKRVVEEPAPPEVNAALERERARQIENEATRSLVDDALSYHRMMDAERAMRDMAGPSDYSEAYRTYQATRDAIRPSDFSEAYRAARDAIRPSDLSEAYRAMREAAERSPMADIMEAQRRIQEVAGPAISDLMGARRRMEEIARETASERSASSVSEKATAEPEE